MIATQTLETPTGPLVSSLSAFPIQRGFDPGPAYRRRIFLLGDPGSGKTTWCNSIERGLLFDFEDGARDNPNPKAFRMGPHTDEKTARLVAPSVTDYYDLMEKLIAMGNHKDRPYDVVIWDTLDTFVGLAATAFCVEEKVETVGDYRQKGAGWSRINSKMFSYLDRLWAAGYGYVVTGHRTEREVTVGGETRIVTRPAVSDSFKKAMYNRCQFLLYSSREEVSKTRPVLDKEGRPILRDDPRSGKRIPMTVPIPGEKIEKYRLRVRVPNSEGLGKARIPIGDALDFNETNGWQTFIHAYDASVAGLQTKKETPNVKQ